MSSSQPAAGPSHPAQRPPATASPLPQPIRRAARAAQPASASARLAPSPASNPRAKSLLGSFKSLSPNQRILIGLAGIVIGGAGLLVDRFVLPEQGEEKPLISVRTVDRE